MLLEFKKNHPFNEWRENYIFFLIKRDTVSIHLSYSRCWRDVCSPQSLTVYSIRFGFVFHDRINILCCVCIKLGYHYHFCFDESNNVTIKKTKNILTPNKKKNKPINVISNPFSTYKAVWFNHIAVTIELLDSIIVSEFELNYDK